MYKKVVFIFLAASLLLVAGCGSKSSGDAIEAGTSMEKTDETLESAADEVNDLDVSDLDSLDEDIGLI